MTRSPWLIPRRGSFSCFRTSRRPLCLTFTAAQKWLATYGTPGCHLQGWYYPACLADMADDVLAQVDGCDLKLIPSLAIVQQASISEPRLLGAMMYSTALQLGSAAGLLQMPALHSQFQMVHQEFAARCKAAFEWRRGVETYGS